MLEWAHPTSHFIISKCSDRYQYLQRCTHTRADQKDCVYRDVNSSLISVWQLLPSRQRPSTSGRTWFLLGTLFPFPAFERKLNNPRTSSSEYIWPIKRTLPHSRLFPLPCCKDHVAHRMPMTAVVVGVPGAWQEQIVGDWLDWWRAKNVEQELQYHSHIEEEHMSASVIGVPYLLIHSSVPLTHN